MHIGLSSEEAQRDFVTSAIFCEADMKRLVQVPDEVCQVF
jgi:hypothetical protein